MSPTPKKQKERRVKAWAILIDNKIAKWSSAEDIPHPLQKGGLIIHIDKRTKKSVPCVITYTLPSNNKKK